MEPIVWFYRIWIVFLVHKEDDFRYTTTQTYEIIIYLLILTNKGFTSKFLKQNIYWILVVSNITLSHIDSNLRDVHCSIILFYLIHNSLGFRSERFLKTCPGFITVTIATLAIQTLLIC